MEVNLDKKDVLKTAALEHYEVYVRYVELHNKIHSTNELSESELEMYCLYRCKLLDSGLKLARMILDR